MNFSKENDAIMEQLLDLVNHGARVGICEGCGEINYGVEPDEFAGKCDHCERLCVTGGELFIIKY